MMTKACAYANAKSTNKMEKIAQLIQEAKDDSDSPIIKELETWQQKYAAELTQEAVKELAIMLIRNYLKPSADAASLFIKMNLPEIFNKQELEDQLEKGDFSVDEKANFESQYLKNTLKTAQKYQLTDFFTPGNHQDTQKILLSNLPSEDLIKLTTTSKLTQKIIIEILFARSDKIALEFQEKTLGKWLKQLREGEPVDSLLSFKDRISNFLMKPETAIFCKIQCSMLLQYLGNNDSEKIDHCLAKAVTTALKLAPPTVERMVAEVADYHETEREAFLKPLGFRKKFEKEEIDALLEKITVDKVIQAANFQRLTAMAADFNEEQLNRAVLLCFEKTCEAYHHLIHLLYPAGNALDTIMKQTSSLSQDTKDFFVKTIEDSNPDNHKDYKARHAFVVLLQLAKNNNPEIFKLLTRIVTDQLNHTDLNAQGRACHWLGLLAPHLQQIDAHFIAVLIENISSDVNYIAQDAKRALSLIAKQLTKYQLAQYSHQCLSLLGEDKGRDDQIRGAKIIETLAAAISSCPYEIIQRLVFVGPIAEPALWQLEPNMLVLQSGIVEAELTNNDFCDDVYRYIIKLAPLLSSQDITDSFIHKLIHSRTTGGKYFELKMKALASIGMRLSDQQLDIYVASCMQHKHITHIRDHLCLIPSSRLFGKLDALFANYSAQLKDTSEKIRSEACQYIPCLENLSPLFPNRFLIDFIDRLNDESRQVRGWVYKNLFKILHLIKNEDLEQVFNQLFSHISGLAGNNARQTFCDYFCILVPRLSLQNIAQAQNLLLRSLEHEDGRERATAFNALAKVVYRLEGEELTSLISTLMSKLDEHSYSSICGLIELLKRDDLARVIELSYTKLENKDYSIRTEACQTLIKIARHPEISEEMLRKIIASLIDILRAQTTDLVQQLHERDWNDSKVRPNQDRTVALEGLIKLVDLITEEEFETIQNLPATSFDMIAGQHVLETLYDAEQSKACRLDC